MPLVNLPRCLGNEDQESTTKNIIVSELNNYFVGFLVNGVSRIHRVSWSVMEPPPNVANSDSVVGIIKMDGHHLLKRIREDKVLHKLPVVISLP